MSFRLSIAATRNDWIALFQAIKGLDDLGFYAFGMLSEAPTCPYEMEQIPNFGVMQYGVRVLEESYIVLPKQRPLHVKTVDLKGGGIQYAVAGVEWNDDCFSIKPGGPFNDCFVIGELYCGCKEGIAVNFAKRLIGRARRSFYSAKGFWVGPECYALYKDSHFYTDDCRDIQNNFVAQRGL